MWTRGRQWVWPLFSGLPLKWVSFLDFSWICMAVCKRVMFKLDGLWPQNFRMRLCMVGWTLHGEDWLNFMQDVFQQDPRGYCRAQSAAEAISRVKCSVCLRFPWCCFGIERLMLWLIVLHKPQGEGNRTACRELQQKVRESHTWVIH